MYNPTTDDVLRMQIDQIFARYDREQQGCLPLAGLAIYCNEVFVMCGSPISIRQDQALEALHNVYPRAEVLNKQILLAVLQEVHWLHKANTVSTVFTGAGSSEAQRLPTGMYHAPQQLMPLASQMPLVGGPPIYQPQAGKSPRGNVSTFSQASQPQPPLLSVSHPNDIPPQMYPYHQMPYYHGTQYQQLKESVVFDVPDRPPPSPRSGLQPRSPRH